jgi:hypothetical protein
LDRAEALADLEEQMTVAYEESLFVSEETTDEQMIEFVGKLREYFGGCRPTASRTSSLSPAR